MLSQISIRSITITVILIICLIPKVSTQCNTYIQILPLGIEGCVLPQVVATQQFLLPCSAPDGFNQLNEGDFAYIDYIQSGCLNFCQCCDEVDITCFSLPTAVGDPEATDEIKIFPTLVEDRIYIEGDGIQQIELYDDRGAVILKLEKPDVFHIDAADFGAGIYFIRVIVKNQIWVKKIIKL